MEKDNILNWQEEPWCRQLNDFFDFSGFLSQWLRLSRQLRLPCRLLLKLYQIPPTALNADVGAVGADFLFDFVSLGQAFYFTLSLRYKPSQRRNTSSRYTKHQLSYCQAFILCQAFDLHQVRKFFVSNFALCITINFIFYMSYQTFRILESRLCFKSSQAQLNHNIKPWF